MKPTKPPVSDPRPFRDRFDLDPTFGYSVEDLLSLQVLETPPADFADFWRRSHRENERVEPAIGFKNSVFRSNTHRIREVYFQSLGAFRIGAWLCTPRRVSKVKRVEILGHGYGGRECPDLAGLKEEAIQIFVCAPGFHLSACPDRVATNCSSLHVLTGIHSPNTYILRFCAAAFWSAARLAEGLYEGIPIVYRGESFGGGIGALMLPWEPRFVAAELVQPTFGFHTFRLEHRCHGSAESVRRTTELVPEIAQTLRYYDAVFSAREIRVPTLAGVCACDPSVPPPGQFAVANAIPEPFRRLSVFSFGHCEFKYPGQTAERLSHMRLLRKLLALNKPL